MPFGNTTQGVHDMSLHIGDAIRDVDNGVAGLDNNGSLITPGDSLLPTLSIADKCFISERGSGELMLQFERLEARTWQAKLEVYSSLYSLLSTYDKDKLDGYAGLDSYGHINPLIHPPVESHTDLSMGVTHPFTQSQTLANGVYTDYTAGGYWQVSSGVSLVSYCTLEYLRNLQVAGFHTAMTMELTTHNAGASGVHTGYIGFKEDFTTIDNLQCAMIEQNQADDCSFITANTGATETTAVTSIDNGDSIGILMETGRCICYINGIVEAVHTANLPTSTALIAGIAAHTNAAGASPRIYGVAGFNVSRSG